MGFSTLDDAADLLEKANADLQPDLLSVPEARERLQAYVRAQRLAASGSPHSPAGSTRRAASPG